MDEILKKIDEKLTYLVSVLTKNGLKKCVGCSKEFIPKTAAQKYCHYTCKQRAYNKRKGNLK
jgi:hypothetical protein